MTVAATAGPKNAGQEMSDAEVVEAYLTASIIPDPDAAAAYMKPGTMITFTGGRQFDHPRGPTGFNARRYRWVKKKMDRFDVCPGAARPWSTASARCTANGSTARRSKAIAMSIASSSGRKDREDGRLERQRRADSGQAGD